MFKTQVAFWTMALLSESPSIALSGRLSASLSLTPMAPTTVLAGRVVDTAARQSAF